MGYNKIQLYKTSLPRFSSLEGGILFSFNNRISSLEQRVSALEDINSGNTVDPTDEPEESPTPVNPEPLKPQFVLTLCPFNEYNGPTSSREEVAEVFSNLITTGKLLDLTNCSINFHNVGSGSGADITIMDLTQQYNIPTGDYYVSGWVGRGNDIGDSDGIFEKTYCSVNSQQIYIEEGTQITIPIIVNDSMVVFNTEFEYTFRYKSHTTSGWSSTQNGSSELFSYDTYYYAFLCDIPKSPPSVNYHIYERTFTHGDIYYKITDGAGNRFFYYTA